MIIGRNCDLSSLYTCSLDYLILQIQDKSLGSFHADSLDAFNRPYILAQYGVSYFLICK